MHNFFDLFHNIFSDMTKQANPPLIGMTSAIGMPRAPSSSEQTKGLEAKNGMRPWSELSPAKGK